MRYRPKSHICDIFGQRDYASWVKATTWEMGYMSHITDSGYNAQYDDSNTTEPFLEYWP